MKLLCAEDYDRMSRMAADLIEQEIRENAGLILGLATGSSPFGIYQCFQKDYREHKISFQEVQGFQLDEYAGLDRENEQSFGCYLQKNLVETTDFRRENLHLIDGCAEDSETECKRYEKELQSTGGVDLQILGLGNDGHVGFNEPGEYFSGTVHITRLTQETVDANARFFRSKEEVPKSAYTMGIGTILRARKIFLIVSGASKAGILREAVCGNITPKVPASILQFHTDCTVIGDKAAFQYLDR